MSEILKKYKHMANTRSDYNTINNINSCCQLWEKWSKKI